MKQLLFITGLFIGLTENLTGQNLPTRWDELVASDWAKALIDSDSTCILPIGVLEKHGPHAPIGTDLIRVREYALRATKAEYAVVFPDYFYGQINEAKHQPGAFALPARVMWDLLEATCDEIARNGFKKILIVNGHGGNPEFLHFFMQTRLEKRRDYAVFLFEEREADPEFVQQVAKLTTTDLRNGDHAGSIETSDILYPRPDLVKLDRAKNESGQRLNRLSLKNVYTPIGWYAGYPNHYDGDGSKASKELGKLTVEHVVSSLAQVLKVIKEDRKTLALQKEFYDRVDAK
ncbi:MAG TPA: creatininase family protein [Chryseolinea sp.]|nr:creatininase family protein [Chryseolinea sp.]